MLEDYSLKNCKLSKSKKTVRDFTFLSHFNVEKVKMLLFLDMWISEIFPV